MIILPLRFTWVLLSFSVFAVACKNNASQSVPASSRHEVSKSLLDSASLINDLAYLSSEALGGRESATPGNELARAFIIKRYDSLRLSAPDSGRSQSFPLRQNTTSKGTNVIAMIKGSTWPDEYFVLSAHYDHLGIKNGAIYYGADDNASGSACLLALARYFKAYPPKHSFVFASFDAEEKGLVGSHYYVAHPSISLDKVLLNVNMDMVSRNDKNEIYVSGVYHYPFLKKYVDSVKQLTTVNVLTGHDNPAQGHDDWTNQSDHYPFHKAKIPFLYFGVEDHPDYHKPSDTFDKIDKGFYYRVCNMVKETIRICDGKEKVD